MIPMWNALSFFTTYANVDGYTPEKGEVRPPAAPANVLDRWILSSCASMVAELRTELDNYNLQKAANRYTQFIDDLTNDCCLPRSRRSPDVRNIIRQSRSDGLILSIRIRSI